MYWHSFVLAFCAVLVLTTIIKCLNGNASKIDLAFQDSLKAMKQVKFKKKWSIYVCRCCICQSPYVRLDFDALGGCRLICLFSTGTHSAWLDSARFQSFSITTDCQLNVCEVVIATRLKVPWHHFYLNATQQWRKSWRWYSCCSVCGFVPDLGNVVLVFLESFPSSEGFTNSGLDSCAGVALRECILWKPLPLLFYFYFFKLFLNCIQM